MKNFIYRCCLVSIKGWYTMLFQAFLKSGNQRLIQLSIFCPAGWNMLNMNHLVTVIR